MRYRDTGDVHLDFHRTMNGTITYLRERYGVAFLDEILRRTACDVYRAIRADLLAGNPEHLLAHWTSTLTREGGEFVVERTPTEIRVVVQRCPAAAYLQERGIPLDPAFRPSVCGGGKFSGTALNGSRGGGRGQGLTATLMTILRTESAFSSA